MTCALCAGAGGSVLFRDALLRVVAVDDPDLPGFVRVIVNAHVPELTDLARTDRARLMDVVYAVEAAQRAALAPAKINVASLGNQVPHLHWHVVPRFADDAFFPDAVWAPRRRTTPPAELAARRALQPALAAAIRRALGAA